MSSLRLRTFVACDKTIVCVWGDIDLGTAPRLQAHLQALTDAGCRALVLNLSHTGYLDGSGLAVLAQTHKALRSAGGTLSVIRCRPSPARVLHLTGFHRLFPVEERLPRAKQSAA